MKDEKIDFKLFEGFALWQTNEQTFVIVESLSRLKIYTLHLSHAKSIEI